jgi:hypothetical protein
LNRLSGRDERDLLRDRFDGVGPLGPAPQRLRDRLEIGGFRDDYLFGGCKTRLSEEGPGIELFVQDVSKQRRLRLGPRS